MPNLKAIEVPDVVVNNNYFISTVLCLHANEEQSPP